ncbi:MAG: imidazolonepropionase [Planctomycetota bacterium]
MNGELLITNANLRAADGSTITADVQCRNGAISQIRDGIAAPPGIDVLDAAGRALLPGFVDCHTHACWAGDRLDEWQQKLAGATYLELLEAGGGIMATVRAVRAATRGQLAEGLLDRLNLMLRHGTTTAEVKSGYGLTTADELKMLEAIALASERWPGTMVPTACIGHAKDPDEPDPVGRTIDETLPAVTAAFPGIAIDAYCERGAWSLEESLRLFDAALEAGHPVRVHADQFTDLGMIPEAIHRSFVSVDHLEATQPEHLKQLAGSNTFGVMLPACTVHLECEPGDGRSFVDAGGSLAIATNYNPGSAPCPSMQLAVALGVRRLGITPDEALTAAALTPAAVLGLDDRGSIRVGQRADLILLNAPDHREVAFSFGANLVDRVWVAGASTFG